MTRRREWFTPSSHQVDREWNVEPHHPGQNRGGDSDDRRVGAELGTRFSPHRHGVHIRARPALTTVKRAGFCALSRNPTGTLRSIVAIAAHLGPHSTTNRPAW